MAPDGFALRLDKVNTFYGESHVLRDVSFTLGRGRVLALLGRNGAGKSTCMSSIAGLVRARRGEIQLHDRPIHDLAPEAISRRGVGLVPQGRRIFPTLSVYENLLVAIQKPRVEGAPRWDLDGVFQRFPALAERRKQAAGSLSGGEQQMLAIARALVSNPCVLLMDEPSEGLAPRIVAEVGETLLALKVGETLLALKAAGLSILLVEQNTTLALRVADDVAILNTGAIVHESPADDVRGRADFLNAHLGIA